MGGRMLYIDDHDNGDEPCTCSDCDWSGLYSELDAATDGVLTPGDPSFAGRCPECDSVAYLDRPKDRAVNALSDVLYAYRDMDMLTPQASQARQRLEDAISEALGGRIVALAIS